MTLKTTAVALFAAVGLMFFSPAVSAQTQTSNSLPHQVAADLSTALNQLRVTLGALQVRLAQQQTILATVHQQFGLIAGNLTVLQNPAFLDTESERKVVGQIIELDAKVADLIKSQVNLVKEERVKQMSLLAQVSKAFAVVTELLIKLKTSA